MKLFIDMHVRNVKIIGEYYSYHYSYLGIHCHVSPVPSITEIIYCKCIIGIEFGIVLFDYHLNVCAVLTIFLTNDATTLLTPIIHIFIKTCNNIFLRPVLTYSSN